MNQEQIEYDRRQLNLMAEQVAQYESGTILLSHLITGLDSLANLLQTTGPDWKSSLKSEWWTLEQVYASALDRNGGKATAADLLMIAEAIANIKKLVDVERERVGGLD